MNLSEFLNEFQLEAGEKLDLIASQLLRLERDATNPQPVREMFLAAHTIKGGAAMLRLTEVEALAHAVEDLLTALRDQQRTLDGPTADLLFQAIDHLRSLIGAASGESVGVEPREWVSEFANRMRLGPVAPVVAVARAPRALVVDSSTTVRELHRMLLEERGYQVQDCDDGHAALSLVLGASDGFDLVVSGIQNTGLGGFELVSRLRADHRCREMQLILASADDDPALADRAAECGANALIRKRSLRDQELSAVLGR